MSRRSRAVLAVAVGLLLAGCVQLPEDGPVVEAEIGTGEGVGSAADIDPLPPAPGASRLEIVHGFIQAMMAWPVKTTVAQQYLTERAAEEWEPTETIIYSDQLTPTEDGSTVTVGLTDVARLDRSGAWQGPADTPPETLRFRLTVEDGEFRILDPPDALVVRTSWFQRRYRRASLYYFDPTAQVLVPEPVFVPVGEQLATSLVSALLAGPPPELEDVVRSYVPPDLTVGLSVPVSDDGLATIDLHGGAPSGSAEASERMLAQLAAALSQDPAISAIRVSIGGEPVPVPNGASEYDVDSAAVFDLTDSASAGVLYGLRRGRLVVSGAGWLASVDGPFGRRARQLSSVSVSPDAARVAAVSASGAELLLGPLRSLPQRSPVRSVETGAVDLARPAWDAAERLWLLDRAPDGARVLVGGRRGPREIRVPGVTGRAARQLLVSRDGTRLVALVDSREGQRIVATRVVLDGAGRPDRAIEPITIWSERGIRAHDVAWAGAAEIAVLTPARPGLFEVETVSVDGATIGVDTLSTIVAGRILGLAGEPDVDSPVYAVTPDALVDVRTGERLAREGGVRHLDYAG